jgi:hypothetical protein
MTKRPEPNPLVMLNLFQHLVGFFLLAADAFFIPVHRKGFSDAILINLNHLSITPCPPWSVDLSILSGSPD